MKVLLYEGLDVARIGNFEKLRRALEAGDFRSADVKKVGDNLYRARLDRSARLLFSLYAHGGQRYVLVLEYLPNHEYDKSRFLRRGAAIDEGKLPPVVSLSLNDAAPLRYLNPRLETFNLLDKVISFDDAQEAVYLTPPPFIVIGAAGSGKTALTLEKLKRMQGEVLYVTRSSFLTNYSRDQYYSLGFEDESQNVSFLSFAEYLASWSVPTGRELQFREFEGWFSRHRSGSSVKDAQQLFEEFNGVLSGAPTTAPYLSLGEYRALGVKQSIFAAAERDEVYGLFRKYLAFLSEAGSYNASILSYDYLSKVVPHYDFVVVDEVQDITAMQLRLILASLAKPGQFILCGDANQIVHPNFFSWAKVKSFFHGTPEVVSGQLVRILTTNYRNAAQVTELSNRILKLKTARFGSVDRESNYLTESSSERSGGVVLLPNDADVTREINRKTKLSARFAVIVADPAQKLAAKQRFDTPLVFTVQEAKGLEYDNIVLYEFASSNAGRFREITEGVVPSDVLSDGMNYSRARDKSDRSLEIHKFYINALYVAVTRAVENVYWVESDPCHRLFELLGLKVASGPLELAEQGSSLETWQREARRLELQGKEEQAEEIRSQILRLGRVPWQVLTGGALEELRAQAFGAGGKKEKLLLFEYALVHSDGRILNDLARAGFKPAMHPERGIKPLTQKYFFAYDVRKTDLMQREVDQYGVDFRNVFNQTPLMIAARLGAEQHAAGLVALGADTSLINNAGLNAFQIALEQACVDPAFARGKLATMYELLAPREVTVRIDGRLLKIDSRSMEYLLFNLMVAMFYTRLGEQAAWGDAFSSATLIAALEELPLQVVPERRKRRQYVSSVLAKNEVDREGRYNLKLFKRLKHGHYVINPRLAVLAEGEWRNVYDLLSLDALGYDRGPDQYFADRLDDIAQRYLKLFRATIRDLREGEEEGPHRTR